MHQKIRGEVSLDRVFSWGMRENRDRQTYTPIVILLFYNMFPQQCRAGAEWLYLRHSVVHLSVCIDEVFSWMMSNRCQLNPSKTDSQENSRLAVLSCSSARRQHQIPTGPVRVGDTSVLPLRTVRDLGVSTQMSPWVLTSLQSSKRVLQHSAPAPACSPVENSAPWAHGRETYVATLPCETLMSAKQAIDKLQGSVATHLRSGAVVNNLIKTGLSLSLRVKKKLKIGEYLAKLQVRTWLFHALSPSFSSQLAVAFDLQIYSFS